MGTHDDNKHDDRHRDEAPPRDNSKPDRKAPGAPPTDPLKAPGKPDPKGGIEREVGDLEDPDAEDDGALPGRVGGGLAGG